MRTKTLLAICALSSAMAAQAQEIPSAAQLMNNAKAVALKQNKAVWVIFHASW